MDFAANYSALTYVGRWGDIVISSTPAKVAISGGLRLRFQFTGTSCLMKFDVSSSVYKPEISWSVDGGAFVREAVNASTKSLATNLASGTHTLDLWVEGTEFRNNRWTSYDGVRIVGITLDLGATLSSWPVPSAGRMLIIGDSIAEGMLVLGWDPNEPPNFSGRQSFGAQLAEQLNLEVWIHAFGGSGFYGTQPDSGIPATQLNYPYKMSGIEKSDPQFDIVLIEAINNDQQNNIQTQYENLIDQVKADHPAAKIFCMGLIFHNPADQPYVQAAAANKGATYISPVGWSYTRPNYDHPDLAGHTAIAAYLNPILAPFVPSETTTTAAPTTTTTAAPTTSTTASPTTTAAPTSTTTTPAPTTTAVPTTTQPPASTTTSTTAAPTTTPAPLATPSITSYGSAVGTISPFWSTVSGASYYNLYWTNDGSTPDPASGSTHAVTDIYSNYYTLSNLAGGTYKISVRAVGASGQLSSLSTPITVTIAGATTTTTTTTTTTPAPTPAPVFVGASASFATANISWTVVSAVSYYELYWTSDGSTPTLSSAVISGINGTSYSHTNLPTGLYSYRVRAIGVNGVASGFQGVAQVSVDGLTTTTTTVAPNTKPAASVVMTLLTGTTTAAPTTTPAPATSTTTTAAPATTSTTAAPTTTPAPTTTTAAPKKRVVALQTSFGTLSLYETVGGALRINDADLGIVQVALGDTAGVVRIATSKGVKTIL